MTDLPRAPVYEAIARLGQAFASPERLRIVDLLAQRRRTVEHLAEAARMSLKLTSHHLQVLRREELVTVTRRGRHATYGLADPMVAAFWLTLRGFAESRSARLALERSRLDVRRRILGRIDRQEALQAIEEHRAFVMDVRPREEYAAAHLPEAVCIPLDELDGRIDEIPHDRLVIAYCRGPYCELADEAVERLAGRGIRAFRLEDGPPDWENGGLPLAVGPSVFGTPEEGLS
jgi:rhodanese-related sulfurtransferase